MIKAPPGRTNGVPVWEPNAAAKSAPGSKDRVGDRVDAVRRMCADAKNADICRRRYLDELLGGHLGLACLCDCCRRSGGRPAWRGSHPRRGPSADGGHASESSPGPGVRPNHVALSLRLHSHSRWPRNSSGEAKTSLSSTASIWNTGTAEETRSAISAAVASSP